MQYKTKADLIDRVTESVRTKIDGREKAIYKTDVRLIVDSIIEESRKIVIEGNPIMVRGLMTITLEDRPPTVVTSYFRGKVLKHLVGHTKAIKMTPCRSFKNAVRERFLEEDAKIDEKNLEEVLT